MNVTKMNIGDYINIASRLDLRDVCGQIIHVMSNFESDIFADYEQMCDIMDENAETRKIWSIRATGTWYMDVDCYAEMRDMDTMPILQFIVESNSYGEMTFTRIR